MPFCPVDRYPGPTVGRSTLYSVRLPKRSNNRSLTSLRHRLMTTGGRLTNVRYYRASAVPGSSEPEADRRHAKADRAATWKAQAPRAEQPKRGVVRGAPSERCRGNRPRASPNTTFAPSLTTWAGPNGILHSIRRRKTVASQLPLRYPNRTGTTQTEMLVNSSFFARYNPSTIHAGTIPVFPYQMPL